MQTKNNAWREARFGLKIDDELHQHTIILPIGVDTTAPPNSVTIPIGGRETLLLIQDHLFVSNFCDKLKVYIETQLVLELLPSQSLETRLQLAQNTTTPKNILTILSQDESLVVQRAAINTLSPATIQ